MQKITKVVGPISLYLAAMLAAAPAMAQDDSGQSETTPSTDQKNILDENSEPGPPNVDTQAVENANEPFEAQVERPAENMAPTPQEIEQKVDAEEAAKGAKPVVVPPDNQEAPAKEPEKAVEAPATEKPEETAISETGWMFTLRGHLAKVSPKELVFYSKQPVMGVKAGSLRNFDLIGLTEFTDYWQLEGKHTFSTEPPFAALLYETDGKLVRQEFYLKGAEPFHEAIKFSIKPVAKEAPAPADIQGVSLFIDASKCSGCIADNASN